MLTVAGLSALDLPAADLAYLSACATTRTNLRLVDEAVQVTAGFLIAGFRQVIGTWWAVPDEVALTMAGLFYTELDGDPARAPEALHRAVHALRREDPRAVLHWAGWVHAGA